MKNLGDIKTIIAWQITKNTSARNIKLNQLTFIQNLVTEKELIDCNANVILIKARSAIEIIKTNDYKKTNL